MDTSLPTRCPLCTSSSLEKVENMRHVDGENTYSLYECGACYAQFWWPLKNPGAHWYEHDHRYADRNKDPIRDPNWNHKKVIAYLKPFVGRVLDVGCGVGNFLAWADKNGWDAYGIDFDHDAVEAGKNMFDLQNLSVADVQEFKAQHPEEKFDLVTFFDVLEHIDNHNEFIETIKSLLTSRGYVAMSMPYRKHAQWLMTGDWPPRHLTRWDRTSLKKFLEDRGFDVVYITRRSEGIRYLILKMRFLFGKKLSFGLVSQVKQSVKNNQTSAKRKDTLVRGAEWLAKTKDAILFGMPAFVVWLVTLPLPSRYITLYAIARKRD
jgi:SAM-dependent methyltransferase